MPNPAEQDPRVYFAAERTLLAWIRTGIALMAFGFAIARFGLFLRQLEITQGATAPHTHWGSPVTGVVLIALGVFINIGASFNHVRTVRQLSNGTWIPGQASRTAVILAAILAILGAAMAIYILLIR